MEFITAMVFIAAFLFAAYVVLCIMCFVVMGMVMGIEKLADMIHNLLRREE